VFDFLTNTTPTGGAELSYLRGILKSFAPKMMTQ